MVISIVFVCFAIVEQHFTHMGFSFALVAPELVKNQGYFGDEVDW